MSQHEQNERDAARRKLQSAQTRTQDASIRYFSASDDDLTDVREAYHTALDAEEDARANVKRLGSGPKRSSRDGPVCRS